MGSNWFGPGGSGRKRGSGRGRRKEDMEQSTMRKNINSLNICIV